MSGFAHKPDTSEGKYHGSKSLLPGQRHDRDFNIEKGEMSVTSSSGRSPNENDLSIGQRMLSAIWGSVLTSLLVTPLDVVRVRLQSQALKQSASSLPLALSQISSFNNLPPNLGVTACCREVFWVNNNAQYCVAGPIINASNGSFNTVPVGECAVEESQRKTFNSTLDGLRKIARNEGLRSLWRGLSPTLMMAIPANVIYFAGYDWLRFNKGSPINKFIKESYAPLIAGSSARIAAAISVSPIEMFRTRLQATAGHGTSHFIDTLRGMRDLVRVHGYASVWRGLTLTLWRDVPFSAIYWWGYETVRNLLLDSRERARGRALDPERKSTQRRSQSRNQETPAETFIDSFTSGAIAGSIAATITTPFDVGKTRQQVFRHADDTLETIKRVRQTPTPEERTMPRFLYHIFKTEGLRGLFKGGIPRVLKVAPSCAIMISSYEIAKKMARDLNVKKVHGDCE